MTAPVTTPEAQRYLAAVDGELSDLPVEERAELLEDLSLHLTALDEETGDARPLEVRLGTPVAYAAELRLAAGLPARGSRQTRPTPALVLQARRTWRRATASPAGKEVLAFLPLLEPAWWLLRAYLLVVALFLVTGHGVRDSMLLGPGVLGLLLVGAAIAASVALARKPLPAQKRQLLRIGEVVLGVGMFFALVGGSSSGPSPDYGYYAGSPAPQTASGSWPLLSTAGPVTDIFPYNASGEPLDGVLLYDQDGRPLRVGEQEWWSDQCRRQVRPPLAADGVPVEFSFPQQYVLTGEALSGGPVAPAQCQQSRPRPSVPLPMLSSVGAPTPSPQPGGTREEEARRREVTATPSPAPAPASPAPASPAPVSPAPAAPPAPGATAPTPSS